MLFALPDLKNGDDKHEGCVRCVVTCNHQNTDHARWEGPVGGPKLSWRRTPILHLPAIVNKPEGIGEGRNADVRSLQIAYTKGTCVCKLKSKSPILGHKKCGGVAAHKCIRKGAPQIMRTTTIHHNNKRAVSSDITRWVELSRKGETRVYSTYWIGLKWAVNTLIVLSIILNSYSSMW